MTIDEAITRERQIAKEQRSQIGHWYSKIMGYDGGYIKKCEVCAEYHEQLAEWLEELKATKNSDIPIIHGKEELELHDNVIRNKAIDDLMEKAREGLIFDEDWEYLLQESEKLKAGEKE